MLNTNLSLLYCPCPSAEEATRLGRWLLEERLAACVNILPAIQTLYRDGDTIIEDTECLLLAKTHSGLRPRVTQQLAKQHPYDCPCILFFNTDYAAPGFAAWLTAGTAPQ